MKRIAIIGGASALAAFAMRALRRRSATPTFEEPEPLADDRREAAPVVEPKPPEEADPSDREVESRLDDETKYERSREEDEAARREAAERLRDDPLTERLETYTDPDR